MKRLLILAMAAMFAVACGDKQLTVEEQRAQYQERINEATRREMLEWQKTLTEEDMLKLRESGETLVTGEEYLRKMRQVNQINKMVNRRPIQKQVK